MADPIDPLMDARAPSVRVRRALLSTLAFAALVAGVSCNELHVTQPRGAAEVRLSADTVILRIGDSTLLRASPVDEDNALLPQATPTWTTSAAGVVTVNEFGLVHGVGAGVVTITASVDDVSGTATAIVSGEPAAVAASAGNGQVAGVNESVAIDPTVRITDGQGNGVFGVPVTFAVTAGGGAVLTTQPITTDVEGYASAEWRLGPVPGANTLTATATGDGLTGNPVAFTATAEVGPPDASASSVEALSTVIPPSNGTATATIVVTVRDALGRTIVGAAVSLAATGAGNTLTQPSSVTDAAGQATGTISSTTAGTKVISAMVNGVLAITQTAEVTVNPGAPAAIAIVTQPAGATSNAFFTTQPAVELQVAFVNRLTDATDAVTVTLVHGDGVLASGSGSFSVNAADGVATFAGLHVRGLRTTGDTLGVGPHVLRFAAVGLAPIESDTFDVEVSFGYNVNDVFTRGCSGGPCHVFTVANIVNQPSVLSCTHKTRVVPGDSTSFIYEKMKPSPSCANAMPFGPLLSERQRRLVRDWIMQGAKDN